MFKSVLNKLYWGFWFSTTILTGILTGYMVSHATMLGRFFNWFIDSGNRDLLNRTYVVLREASRPDILYYVPLYLCFASGVIWVALAYILKKDRILSTIAGLSVFWVGNIFTISDLDEAEQAVFTGTADDRMAQFYTSINLPLHITFAVIFGACFFILLLIGLKKYKLQNAAKA